MACHNPVGPMGAMAVGPCHFRNRIHEPHQNAMCAFVSQMDLNLVVANREPHNLGLGTGGKASEQRVGHSGFRFLGVALQIVQ